MNDLINAVDLVVGFYVVFFAAVIYLAVRAVISICRGDRPPRDPEYDDYWSDDLE